MIALLAAVTVMLQPNTIPGVTIWVWDIGEPLPTKPHVIEGQTPNYYAVHEQINFKDGFKSDAEDLKDMFVGEARGWIRIDEPGRYNFRAACDDGATLILDGQEILNTDVEGFEVTMGIDLNPGLHEFRMPFYENGGNFYLRLSWQKPGDSGFELIPSDNLRTEPGQTFVVSPGPKKYFFGEADSLPGDGRPLDAVHPSMTLENFRGPEFMPPVGALTFLPDGRLAVATWDPEGAIYFLSNLNGPGPVEVERFAAGLGEPLGLKWWRGSLYVTQKRELTRLTDTDGDGFADKFDAVAFGWPMSHNYHEFSFNLVEKDGSFFIGTSVPLKSGDTNYTPGTTGAYAVPNGGGLILKVDPETGNYEVYADGMRTPNGMNVGTDGEMFVCDNQGSWLPSSAMYHVKPGGKYLHQLTPDGDRPAEQPVVWFPQGEIGNSPSEPVLISDGIYRRQMLVGDVTHGGIKRVFVEKVGGDYQGCVFRFSQGIEAGVNRLVWGPDGCLYVGGIGSNGNWNHQGHKFGLQRLRPNGETAFEMKSVEARDGGFLISFTKPVPQDVIARHESYALTQWRYEPKVAYGGPKIDQEVLSIQEIDISGDRRQAFLRVEGLKAGHVVHVRLRDFESDAGDKPWSTEAWYTLNKLSSQPHKFAVPAIFYPFDLSTIEVLFNGRGINKLTAENGGGKTWGQERDELIVDLEAGSLVTQKAYGSCWLHVEWLAPAGGVGEMGANSGVKLMGRYEVQILNSPAYPFELNDRAPGAIYGQAAATANASTGAGTWQSYDILFTAPRWNDDTKASNARMSVWWNGVLVQNNVEVPQQTGASPLERPGKAPILFQAHESDSEESVRFRNIWIKEL